jgi:hypothetical protein
MTSSQVSASSALGIDGQVDIRAPVSNLSGLVTPLPPGFAQAVVLLVDRCAARLREGTVSSFVVRGRDGMPANPTGVLPSPLYPASPSIAEPTRSGQHQRETTASRQRKLRRDTKKNRQVRSLPAATVPSPALELECVLR